MSGSLEQQLPRREIVVYCAGERVSGDPRRNRPHPSVDLALLRSIRYLHAGARAEEWILHLSGDDPPRYIDPNEPLARAEIRCPAVSPDGTPCGYHVEDGEIFGEGYRRQEAEAERRTAEFDGQHPSDLPHDRRPERAARVYSVLTQVADTPGASRLSLSQLDLILGNIT